MKSRIVSIDILRFIATLAIFNHLAQLYLGRFSFLASGGAMGCSLFFFCSGYMLSLGRLDRFDGWYKRRLGRLWPTCFAVMLVNELFCHINGGVLYAIKGVGWFVEYILLFYVIFWIVQYCFKGRSLIVVLALGVLVLLYGMFVYPKSNPMEELGVSLFGYNFFFNRVIFVLPFFLGAVVPKENDERCNNFLLHLALALISLLVFYAYYYFARGNRFLTNFQILVMVPLLCFVYCLHKVVSCETLYRIMQCRRLNWIVCFVGGLSLEMYLTNASFMGAEIRNLISRLPFPAGYLIGFIATVTIAYLVRALGRFLGQTFVPPKLQDEYDWREIWRLV